MKLFRNIQAELGAVGLKIQRQALFPGTLLFLAPCFFMALAYTFFSDQFGKLGVPVQLPASMGAITNFQPKLFPMEIFLAGMAALTASRFRSWDFRSLRGPLPALVCMLLGFGLLRALPDLRTNPMLVIRNSAFVWYLTLPLMIALYPIPSRQWEMFFRALYLVVFGYFVINLAYPFLAGNLGKMWWSIDLGLLFALAFGLCGTQKILPRICLAAIGFAVGISYFGSLQRTTLLGLGLTIAILLCAFLFSTKFPRPRWARIGWLAAGVALAVAAASAFQAGKKGGDIVTSGVEAVATANPGRIAEKNEFGFEKFRWYMWRDSMELFSTAPFHGIGFLRPVVYRAYAGAGQFMDNLGSFEQLSQFRYEKKSPPLAGPHNSYLNALARLGLLGAGFLILHLVSGAWFLHRGYYACFFILLWQMLYAAFNVSLEGPIRSFPILLLVGVAIKASTERRRA